MSKAFRNAVLRTWPDMIYVERSFIHTPVSHIATGFAIDRPPSGARLWRVHFPLYVPSEFFHLTFSDQLPMPDGFISLPGQLTSQELADEFVRRSSPYRDEVRRLGDLNQFKCYLETQPLDVPSIREAHALTMVMLGRGDAAMESLKVLSADVTLSRARSEFISRVDNVIEALELSVGNARELLSRWEVQARMRFGLAV